MWLPIGIALQKGASLILLNGVSEYQIPNTLANHKHVPSSKYFFSKTNVKMES